MTVECGGDIAAIGDVAIADPRSRWSRLPSPNGSPFGPQPASGEDLPLATLIAIGDAGDQIGIYVAEALLAFRAHVDGLR